MTSSGFCGFSLRKNIVVLALIDLICEIVGTTFGVVILVNVIRQFKKTKNAISINQDVEDRNAALIVELVICITSLTIHIAVYLIQVCLSVLLLIGAFQKSFQKCKIWLNITVALLVISVLIVLMNYIFGADEGKPTSGIAPQLFLYLFKAYMLWIVYAYMSLLRYNNHTREMGIDDADECQD